MRIIILKKKTGYALGLLLCIIGIAILFAVLWTLYQAKALTSLSAVSEQLLEGGFSVLGTEIEIVGLKPVHYILLGVVLLVVGGAILIARREKIPVVEEVNVLLECPYCNNRWQESMSRNPFRIHGLPSGANTFPTQMS